jgi:carbon monoxide dehydrogenase subunit G
MKIAGSYELAVPREKAYALLQNPDILGQCIPGAEGLTKVGDYEYEMKLKMMLASISGSFTGKVTLAEQKPPESFKLIVEGNGKIGFLKGEGTLHLSPNETGTTIAYEGDVQVGGTMAAIGQRLIDTTSKMMIKKFFDKFAELAKAQSAG